MSEKTAGAFRRKGTVVLATVIFTLIAFASTTQTWLQVRLPQDAVQTPDIQVPGSEAATAVTAFALVALAAALAVSISGKTARMIISGVLVVAGGGIVWNSLRVLADPVGAAAPAIGNAIGVSSGSGAGITATAMPWAAVVAGLLLVLAAVWIGIAGRSWGRSRRYENVTAVDTRRDVAATTAHADEIDSWDRLTKGEDPTR